MKSRKKLPGAGVTIELTTKIGPITVMVDALDRGLAVHPALDGKGATLTHAPSGRKVADFGTRRAALLAMRACLRLTRWNRSASKMSADARATKAQVLACIARHGGKRHG